jgi:hypothetical protein
MPIKLGRALKREVEIHGAPYTVTVSPLGVRLVRKGFRKGVAVSWRRLLQLTVGDQGSGTGDPGAAAGDRGAPSPGGPEVPEPGLGGPDP